MTSSGGLKIFFPFTVRASVLLKKGGSLIHFLFKLQIKKKIFFLAIQCQGGMSHQSTRKMSFLANFVSWVSPYSEKPSDKANSMPLSGHCPGPHRDRGRESLPLEIAEAPEENIAPLGVPFQCFLPLSFT